MYCDGTMTNIIASACSHCEFFPSCHAYVLVGCKHQMNEILKYTHIEMPSLLQPGGKVVTRSLPLWQPCAWSKQPCPVNSPTL